MDSNTTLLIIVLVQTVFYGYILHIIFNFTKLQKARTLEEYKEVEEINIVQSNKNTHDDEERYMSIDDTPADWLKEAINSKNK